MGKDLKGKELGVGISQRKDGLYTARITDSYGKRVQKYFPKLQECRKWIADMQFQKEHGTINAGADMTVDAWFDYWIEQIRGNLIKDSTKKALRTRYEKNIKDCIGGMILSDVKPLHCQNLLNRMSSSYQLGSIQKTRTVIHSMFECAVENDIIPVNPVRKSVRCHSDLESVGTRVLTLEEQKIFVEVSKNYSFHLLYRFALQTGMRIGELTGLKWSDIDTENRILTVQRSTTWVSRDKGWVTGDPKTESGKRKIPLTDEALVVLQQQREKNKNLKSISFAYRDNVFFTAYGNPLTYTKVDEQILRICDKIGMERFSMHTLRHTFATRCIEAGMKPKILQKILGHANIRMTMDLYVHATEEEKENEIRKAERYLKVV